DAFRAAYSPLGTTTDSGDQYVVDGASLETNDDTLQDLVVAGTRAADGTVSIEMSHPLCSDHAQDFCLNTNDVIGFAFTFFDGLLNSSSPISITNASSWAQLQIMAASQPPAPSGRIVFDTNGTGGAIYSMDADGGNQKNLTPDGTLNFEPALSPDGSKIAFGSLRDTGSRGQIYVMNVD